MKKAGELGYQAVIVYNNDGKDTLENMGGTLRENLKFLIMDKVPLTQESAV